jgi:hypothetical protein
MAECKSACSKVEVQGCVRRMNQTGPVPMNPSAVAAGEDDRNFLQTADSLYEFHAGVYRILGSFDPAEGVVSCKLVFEESNTVVSICNTQHGAVQSWAFNLATLSYSKSGSLK